MTTKDALDPGDDHELAGLLPLTDLAFNILVALKGAELHGYALIRELRERTGREQLRTGTVYAALARLQDEGLVEECAGPLPLGDDERRRYYRLTTRGLSAARAEAARLAEVLGIARAKALLAEGEAGS
ncbi:MAG: PadR family transcriptional regulator [Gemmatimonadetes bacterium]|nr:PadR family transcriptional regulator [Gemmatimonadota bacterium]